MLAEWWESPDGKQRFLSENEAREQCGNKISHKIGKMSKQLRNYRSPQEIFDAHGADALRWFFFANQAPWNSIIYSERAIKESIPEFLLRLWHIYSFFVIYANIDGFTPAELIEGEAGQLTADDLGRAADYRPLPERGELDRWVLSELNSTVAEVIERMDAYDNFAACARLNEFVDALSNWYVRRSRDRFWSSDTGSDDKRDAYWTLYECLVGTAKLIAPFTPFLAEALWQNLAGVFGDRTFESIHLCDFPECDEAVVDATLSDRMKLLREVASLGRSARMDAKLKVRQPLSKVEVILADDQHQGWLEEHDALLCEELNVKQVEYTKEADHYISYHLLPNFTRLGPRLGPLMPKVKKALAEADAAALLRELKEHGKIVLNIDGQSVELDAKDVQPGLQAKEGWAAAEGRDCVVVLSTELTPQLIREGHARDLVRLIQDRRKDLDCKYTDRIQIGIVTSSDEVQTAIDENVDYITGETLAVQLACEPLDGTDGVQHAVAGSEATIYVSVVPDA